MFSTCCYFCWFSDPPLAPSWCRMGWKWCQKLIRWVVFYTISTHTAPKKPQPTTPRTFSFVTLAPKPDFHLHCDQPQHETHNLQHTLSEWICGCFGIPLKNQCLRMLFLYSTQGSDKICQDLQRSAKIKQDQPKDRQAQTCKRHLQKQIMKRRNARFHLPNPPNLWPNFNQILMFFRVSFSDTLFSSFFQHDTQKHDFGIPLGIQLGPKWHPKSAQWRA
mgnify:CR=1 FL=1